MNDWHVFNGLGMPHDGIVRFIDSSPPPPWRRFYGVAPAAGELSIDPELEKRFSKARFFMSDREIEVVNAAIHLRRPLLVTGKPGTGKSTLAHAIAHELKLGKVLSWPITSRSTLQNGLYRYDAIGRLQEATLGHSHKRGYRDGRNRVRDLSVRPRVAPSGDTGSSVVTEAATIRQHTDESGPVTGRFIRLGPLGTSLVPSRYPRVLLIDEIDKCDIDLPNDLLHVFEEGRYEIDELSRMATEHAEIDVFSADSDTVVRVTRGRIACSAFPIIVMTSNGEREFPAPFLRRCVRLNIPEHDQGRLANVVGTFFPTDQSSDSEIHNDLIQSFLLRRDRGDLATDQLLNAIYLAKFGFDLSEESRDGLVKNIWEYLSGGGG